jgi:para-aminobenzoate synthetase/4-amino-4-deoxychorismate lyase
MTSPATRLIEPPFSLLETMRLADGMVARLERHLARMRASAAALAVPWREREVRALIDTERGSRPDGTWRFRLLVDGAGQPAITCSAHADRATVWRIAVADAPVDHADPRLVHKTTSRQPYEIARRSRPDVDDVVMWNLRNEVTESTIANLVVEVEGERCTPPLSCGLLGGVLRAELLDQGELVERIITRGMLARAERVWLINSLRGWIEAMVVR